MKKGKGPNYAAIAAIGAIGGGAIGGAAHFALKLPPMEAGIGAVIGFVVAAGVALIPSSGGDTKRLVTENLVKKNVDQAYQAQSLGKLDQSEKLLVEALEKGQSLGDNDLNILAATHSLANLYRLQNKQDQAVTTYRKALASYETLNKTSDMNYATCLRDCAYVLLAQGQNAASSDMAKKALGIAENLNQAREVAELNSLIGRNMRAAGDYANAIPVYLRVKELQSKQNGPHSPQAIEAVFTLARCYRSQTQLTEALEQYKDALVRINKSDRPDRASEAEALLEMAEVRLEQGAPKDVEPICLGSLKVLQTYVGPRSKLLTRLAQTVKEARTKLGQPFSDNELLWLFTQDRDYVRDLLREKPELVTQKDKLGWGTLQWSIFVGWDDVMRWLMRNEVQKDGFEATVLSPVHLAAAWAKGSSITFLDENKVTLDVVGPNGWSAVHHSSYHGRQDCLEQLLARGCDVNRLDQQGRSALHLAAEQGKADVVSLLLSKGLDKNAAETKWGRTPLHLAAAAGHGSVVHNLLMNGADEKITDKQGKTPIQLAEDAGRTGLVSAIKHFREVMA